MQHSQDDDKDSEDADVENAINLCKSQLRDALNSYKAIHGPIEGGRVRSASAKGKDSAQWGNGAARVG